jgi:hypothetical protein
VLTSASGPSVNALKYIGRSVRFAGTVKKVLSPGIPISLLMESNGCRWIAQAYDTDSIPETAIARGKRIVVAGTILGMSDPSFISGTSQSLLLVMAGRISAAGSKFYPTNPPPKK